MGILIALILSGGAVACTAVYVVGNNILNARLKAAKQDVASGRQAKATLDHIETMVWDHRNVNPTDNLLAEMIMTELRKRKEVT